MTSYYRILLSTLTCLFLAACNDSPSNACDEKVDNTIKSKVQSKNWKNLRFEIHEIPCFGRNILEADLSNNGSEITSEIIYRRNHSIWFKNKPDSVLKAARKDIGEEFDQILLDTVMVADRKRLIQDLSYAYDNRKSSEATIAGYRLEVNLIFEQDTLTCTANNPAFLYIFK